MDLWLGIWTLIFQKFNCLLELEASIDLYTVFSTFDMDKLGKNRQHHWNERLKISNTA